MVKHAKQEKENGDKQSRRRATSYDVAEMAGDENICHGRPFGQTAVDIAAALLIIGTICPSTV